MKTMQMSSKLCRPFLNSLVAKFAKKSTTKQLEINCKKHFKVQTIRKKCKNTQNWTFLIWKHLLQSKNQPNNLPYIALGDYTKNFNRKAHFSTIHHGDMLISCHGDFCKLTTSHFAIVACRHGAPDFLQYISTPTSTTCTQTFCIPNQKMEPFIEWDSLWLRGALPISQAWLIESVLILSCKKKHFLL